MKYELVAGWTVPLDISLFASGAKPEGTMGGMSAELVLKDMQGQAIDTSGDVTVYDAANWVVRYSPDPLDLVEGSYHMRVKITDSGGKVCYFPSGRWDELIVQGEG